MYAALANGTVVPFQITTSVFELEGKSEIAIFPNPASSNGLLSIKNPGNENIELSIRNMAGQLIGSYQINSNSTDYNINLDNYNSGIYLISVTSEKGNFIQKLIVK